MSSDRGYTLLLNHLHNAGTTLLLPTIQGALAHHLATLSPSPSPLAATAISSPFYLSQPISFPKLSSLSTAFRHASHLKYRALIQDEQKRSRVGALFRKSALASMEDWVQGVVAGLQGGHPVLRVACCTGIILGMEDVKHPSKELGKGLEVRDSRCTVEDEAIVALAEVMDAYTIATNGGTSAAVEEWEKEFQPAGEDLLSLALIFASQSFPLVSQTKLKALPLPSLARILTSTISATFKNGTLLSSVSASVTLSAEQQVHISPTSAFAQTLHSITTSPLIAAVASISRFTSNVMSLLLDSPSWEDLDAVANTLSTLRNVAKTIEKDWLSTSLASVTDGGVAPDSKEMARSVWTVLKTLLFSIIMISDGVLSPLVFLPPKALHQAITASSLALSVLDTFSHLAFVISQFGGVTSTGKGFEELKKTFYLSLDILAWGDGSRVHGNSEAETYVRQSCVALNSQRGEGNVAFRQAKQALTLASIEQLVPVLSDKCIRDWVWGACYPHLNDPSHRETFESAHSVVLAIFASHAAQHYQGHRGIDASNTLGPAVNQTTQRRPFAWLTLLKSNRLRALRDRSPSPDSASGIPETNAAIPEAGASPARFVQRMVPFYASCLVENSAEGRLSTTQLRMAYAALVSGACASVTTSHSFPAPLSGKGVASSSEKEDRKGVAGGAEIYSLGWYCIQVLLDALQEISTTQGQAESAIEATRDSKGKGKAAEPWRLEILQDTGNERIHRLHLTLISTISSLPLPLLARVLPAIKVAIVTGEPQRVENLTLHPSLSAKQQRKELVEALFEEILESVGDREKEYSMKWWYEHREALAGTESQPLLDRLEKKGEASSPSVTQSRL